MGKVFTEKKYSIKELYSAVYKGIRTFPFLRKCRKSGMLSEQFVKRIMLAVTQVNECEVCSYAHTKMALEMGMSQQEIEQLLSGVIDDIPADEMKAILFSQHYADMKGKPSKASWQEIVEEYGEEKAMGILGAIRMITAGNTFGIAFGAFKNRLQGKREEQSGLLQELGMTLSIIPIFPVAVIHSLLLVLFKRPVMIFQETTYEAKTI